MKIMILYVFLLALLTACEDDRIDFSEESREILFSLKDSTVQTRAWGTSFDVGDKIGIYIVRHRSDVTEPKLEASGNFADNKCYKVMEGGILQANSEFDKIYAGEEGYVYSVFAYYPYNGLITDPTNINFEIDGYQADIESVKRADFMTAQTFYANSSKPIVLIFQRQMAFVNVVYDKNPEGITPEHVAIYGLYPKCKVNLQTGIVQEGDDNPLYGYITPMYKSADLGSQYNYFMIVPPFNFKHYVRIQVSVNGTLSHYFIRKSYPLQPGSTNTFYLSEDNRNVTCSVTTDEGVGGSISGGGIYKNGRQCTVSAKAYDGYIFNGWFKNGVLMSKSLDYTFVVQEDVHLEARFSEGYVITLNCNFHGYGDELEGAGIYRKNEVCYLKAVKIKGMSNYDFVGWFVDGKLMSRDWWYSFVPKKSLNIEARYDIVWHCIDWITEEITFPAGPGTFAWERACAAVTSYRDDKLVAVHTIQAFFVEDGAEFYSSNGAFRFEVELKTLNLDRLLGASYGAGVVRYQNLDLPGFHIERKIKYQFTNKLNRPIKGKMYYYSISYKDYQWDVEPYNP